MKAAIRSSMRGKLKILQIEYVECESKKVFERLSILPEYIQSSGVSIFLSMNGEVQTSGIIANAFSIKKKVAIPKILGKKSEDMFMFEVMNEDQLEMFPKNSWGIAEPPLDMILQSQDCTYNGSIDLVLVPGVAFDEHCGRLGHGKGYYDCFIERVFKSNAQLGKPCPVLVGIALDEQILSETLPMDAHDRYLDFVITPSRTKYVREFRSL
eukprot:gene29297-38371_t